jgi:hypothetical protein
MTAKCLMFLLTFAVSLLVSNIGAQAAGPSFVYDSLGQAGYGLRRFRKRCGL